MKRTTYTSPQDAEAAFYEALESGDLEAMMAIWAEDEEIVCVHPGGPRLVGYADVRASWSEIFSSGRRLSVQATHQVALGSLMLVVHSVRENIAVRGEGNAVPVVATNAYLRTGNGWRMILHHASPVPQGTVASQRASEPEPPKVLH